MYLRPIVCFCIRDELGRDKYTAVMKRKKEKYAWCCQ
ncbi:hypothetical protein OBE_03703, partial [human gut metagenome]